MGGGVILKTECLVMVGFRVLMFLIKKNHFGIIDVNDRFRVNISCSILNFSLGMCLYLVLF